MKHEDFLRPQQRPQTEGERQLRAHAVLEFKHADEMLRYDSMRTDPPSSLARRLQQSINQQPKKRSWWRRFFGAGG